MTVIPKVEYTLRGGVLSPRYDDTLADYAPPFTLSNVVPEQQGEFFADTLPLLTKSFTLPKDAPIRPLATLQSFDLEVNFDVDHLPEMFLVRLWVWVKSKPEALQATSYSPFPEDAKLKTTVFRLNGGEVKGTKQDGAVLLPLLRVNLDQPYPVYRMRLEVKGLFDLTLYLGGT